MEGILFHVTANNNKRFQFFLLMTGSGEESLDRFEEQNHIFL